MNLIDTHAHLTFEQFSSNLPEVLDRSVEAGVTSWITVGTDPQENRKVAEIVKQFSNLYGSVGIHPHYASKATDWNLSGAREYAAEARIVAVGEIGLDFHYPDYDPHRQRQAFIDQLKIADELQMPVIVHSRDAFDETMEILAEHGDGLKIVIHCFSGSAEQARRALGAGYFISFTGVVTFKNARKTQLAAAEVPLDRLMVETDCPFMSPEPMRKQKINEPALIVHTAEKLAELNSISLGEFARIVTVTSNKFFNLPAEG